MQQIGSKETARNLEVAVRQGHGDGYHVRVQIDPGQSLTSVREKERNGSLFKGKEMKQSNRSSFRMTRMV
ncbi:hypothetical protein [Brockia lithotrophica]|uniref:hypothetical protein n=1 Tax=Brockia lithotrophica TaxID=933949 RepID=UPI000EADEE0E|nr:hypothetical protein [Brockia lithotrophica]